jgi:hypothetical protein
MLAIQSFRMLGPPFVRTMDPLRGQDEALKCLKFRYPDSLKKQSHCHSVSSLSHHYHYHICRWRLTRFDSSYIFTKSQDEDVFPCQLFNLFIIESYNSSKFFNSDNNDFCVHNPRNVGKRCIFPILGASHLFTAAARWW